MGLSAKYKVGPRVGDGRAISRPVVLALPSQASGPSLLRRHRFKEPQPAPLHTVSPLWASSCPHSSGLALPLGLPSKALSRMGMGTLLDALYSMGWAPWAPSPGLAEPPQGLISTAALDGSPLSLLCPGLSGSPPTSTRRTQGIEAPTLPSQLLDFFHPPQAPAARLPSLERENSSLLFWSAAPLPGNNPAVS